MESFCRDRLRDMAEHKPFLKNNQNTSRFRFTPKGGAELPKTGVFAVNSKATAFLSRHLVEKQAVNHLKTNCFEAYIIHPLLETVSCKILLQHCCFFGGTFERVCMFIKRYSAFSVLYLSLSHFSLPGAVLCGRSPEKKEREERGKERGAARSGHCSPVVVRSLPWKPSMRGVGHAIDSPPG